MRRRETRAADSSSKTGHVYVKQHPGDAQLPLDELRDVVDGKEKRFQTVCWQYSR